MIQTVPCLSMYIVEDVVIASSGRQTPVLADGIVVKNQ